MNDINFFTGVVFDGNGSAKKIKFGELDNYYSQREILWLHFDYTNLDAIDWLTNKSNIDSLAIDALLTEETRPRTTILNDSVLLALRGINLNPNANPEDMVSIR